MNWVQEMLRSQPPLTSVIVFFELFFASFLFDFYIMFIVYSLEKRQSVRHVDLQGNPTSPPLV